jgi:hypothetical protein
MESMGAPCEKKMHGAVPEVVAEASFGDGERVGDDDAGGWGVPFR